MKDYFKELGCPYWHEYRDQFSEIDFRDKVVVVVGGDCGSTCVYAYLHGAKNCIMFESDQKLRDLASKVMEDLNIKFEVRGEWNGKEYPQGDIFLIDCEGCEENLDIDYVVKNYKQSGIAIHEWTKNKTELLKKLAMYKARLTYVTQDSKELYFVVKS